EPGRPLLRTAVHARCRLVSRPPRTRAREPPGSGHRVERIPESPPVPRTFAPGWGQSVFLRSLGAHEPIRGIREQHVEGGEAAVGARDVVLELETIGVAELRVRVDALLEDPQALPDRNDLPEEGLDGDDLLLRACLAGLHHELPA